MLQAYIIGLLLHSGVNERYQSILMAVIDEGFEVNIYKSPLRDPLYTKALTRISEVSLTVAAAAAVIFFATYTSLYVPPSLVPLLCTPLLLLPQSFLSKPRIYEETTGKVGFVVGVLAAYDCLAIHTLLRCPLNFVIRAVVRTVCFPRLAEIICLHLISNDCAAVGTGAWLTFDWVSLILLQAELAVIFLSPQHNFTKVKTTQLNFLPVGFIVCIFGKTTALRLLGVAASVHLTSQVTF